MKLRTLEAIYHYRRVGRRALSLLLACVMLFSLAAPALSMTIAVVSTESTFDAGELTDGDGTYSVRVIYDEDAQLPEGVTLKTYEVNNEAYLRAAEAEFSEGHKAVYSRFFEISLVDEEGTVIQPAAPVGVVIDTYDREMIPEDAELNVFHYPEEHNAGVEFDLAVADSGKFNIEDSTIDEVYQIDGYRMLSDGDSQESDDYTEQNINEDTQSLPEIERIEAEEDNENIIFMADGFSVYGVIYTVDFRFNADGKEFEYKLIGGCSYSLSSLLSVLGVITDDPSTDVDEVWNFIEQIEEVTFTNTDLLWIGKVDVDTKIGDIISEYNLQVQYSEILSEEDIQFSNDVVVSGGDWAIISLSPFQTDEELKLMMKSGEIIAISVTDAIVNNTTDITNYGYYYIYTYTDGSTNYANNYALKYDGSSSTFNPDNPDLGNDYMWKFTQGQNNTWIIQNVGYPEYYLTLSSDTVTNTNQDSVYISNRNDTNRGLDIYNIEYSIFYPFRWTNYLTIDKSTNPYSYTLNSSSGSRMRLATATPSAQDVPHVTVHFVDRDGNPIPGVNYTENYPVTKLPDEGNTIGQFVIPYDWSGTSGTIDFETDFSFDGYTYANAHLAKITSTSGWTAPNYNQNGLNIYQEIESKNNKLYFKTYLGHNNYSSNNSASDYLSGFEELDFNSNVQTYQISDGNTKKDYATAGNKDVYIVLDELPTEIDVGNTGSSPTVKDPEFKKTLTSNKDGTYNLSLTATTYSASSTQQPKANIVLVVDTSSSMTSNEVNGKTRLEHTKTVLNEFATELFKLNEGSNNHDTVEVAMISFDSNNHVLNDRNTQQTIWMKTKTEYNTAANNLYVHKGTNWEDSLQEAYNLASVKKADGDMTFVIFFTDGEPSQYTNFHQSKSNEYQNDSSTSWKYFHPYFSRESSNDEARLIVREGIGLYTVFAFGKNTPLYNNESCIDLLHNLTRYAYNTDDSADLSNKYFFNADDPDRLHDAFMNILHSIKSSLNVTSLQMNDNITSLTSVGVTPLVGGSYTGFKYTKTGGQYETQELTWEEAPSATYDSTGVHWDLSNATLESGVTYKVSFTVWPSQESYDWVADLNNGIKTWEQLPAELKDHFIQIPDSSRPSGYRYEVATNPPSKDQDGKIVNNKITYTKTTSETVTTKPDDVLPNVPVVVVDDKTGTKTTTTYTPNPDGTYTKTVVTEAVTAFGPPDINMDLSDSNFKMRKLWQVSKPLELIAYLYNTETGEVIETSKSITFNILEDNNITPYKIVKMEYIEPDEEEGTLGHFPWSGDTYTIPVNGREYVYGSAWEVPLDIPFGLMITNSNALDRGIDISDRKYYPVYNSMGDAEADLLEESNPGGVDSITPLYYVLERGHDFTMEEPIVNFRFDFEAGTFHPMLVGDGDSRKPKDVEIEYKVRSDGRTVGILKNITPDTENWISLTGENILRGDLTIEKILLNEYGEQQDDYEAGKDSVFPITITLYNENAPFYKDPTNSSEQHIPWYGVYTDYEHHQNTQDREALFYHYFNDNGDIVYVNEAKACVDGHYSNGLINGYYGNEMDPSEEVISETGVGTGKYKKVSITINFRPDDRWVIANIPVGTIYTITEEEIEGYDFVQIQKTISSDNTGNKTEWITESTSIERPIVQNDTSNVVITNEVSRDLQFVKVQAGSDITMQGVEFMLYKDEDLKIEARKAGTVIGTKRTDENGVFKLKDILSNANINDNVGKYYFSIKNPDNSQSVIALNINIDRNSKTATLTTNNVSGNQYNISILPNVLNIETSQGTGDDKIDILNPDVIIPLVSNNVEFKVTNSSGQPAQYVDVKIFTDSSTSKLATYPGQKVGKIITDSNGIGKIGNLPVQEGAYYLVETKTHDGFNLLTEPVKIYVNEEKITYILPGRGIQDCERVVQDNTALSLFSFTVPNNPGIELPSTGGHGTIAFTIAGITLAITSGAILTRRHSVRRKD